MPRATVDNRPLFEVLRRYAYATVKECETYEEFLNDLYAQAGDWLITEGRTIDGSPAPEEWTEQDHRKVKQTAQSVARWTWDRMR